ncbi:alpha-amylase family glycosyl hydrolase [Salinimonas chungwhensis]|uniref:alpha-amylase family glycosyl hydrolase n=1 Tax=Salinimonas chungwhensis TaxID=265425 RepID=UPI0003729322|nr:alpha-amylase family glycosyl hydrolase [Salinimonas chungwhensis]
MKLFYRQIIAASVALALTGCAQTSSSVSKSSSSEPATPTIRGTDNPFAKEAIYFVVTDRFVDGDPTNNQEEQGGDHPTWNLELEGPQGKTANVGYMGGDLQGVLNNGDYIKDLGFTAVWLTPILDNPDQAFTGDEPVAFGEQFKDGGKTGYHGYWATNFYKADEHLVSDSLSYADYTQAMREQYGLKSVFDIVANHGSPSFSMPEDQPGYGELYDAEGKLVADHQNLHPTELDPNNPLHAFFHPYPDLVKLSNLDEHNPDVQKYLINAYLYWIEQGADAFRIDTIRHVSHDFWRTMSDRIRAEHPDFFMFGESFEYDANAIAQHTLPKNGGVSVLDFPMQKAMNQVFGKDDAAYTELEPVLHLTHGPYNNPYELTTFYDNHDMPRMQASDEGFINAHNWLFTARGIPVVYQGSEIGFMRGTAEHAGNRNYLGQERIDSAESSEIYGHLKTIAHIRQQTPALQRGLQINLNFTDTTAAFYRVVQDEDARQTALVLLNKGDKAASFDIDRFVQAGSWQEQITGETMRLNENQSLQTSVPPNGVRVWLLDGPISNNALLQKATAQLERQ